MRRKKSNGFTKRKKPIINKIRDFKKDFLTLPNMLTTARIVATPLILWLIFVNTFSSRNTALITYFLASWTDFFDGYLARKLNSVTVTGKLLDPLADKFNVLLPLLVFLYLKEISLLLVILIFARELYMFGIRNMAMENNLVIAAEMGGKIKTMFQMFGIGFLITHETLFKMIFGDTISANSMGSTLLWSSILFSYFSAYSYTLKLKRKLFENR